MFESWDARKRWLWFFVVPATVLLCLCFGSMFAFSVFIIPIRKECPNFNDGAAVHALSVLGAVVGLTSFVIGPYMSGQGNLSKITAFGSVVTSGGCSLGALGVFHCQEWLLYVGFGLVQGIGWGALYMACLQHIMRWTAPRTGMAAGIFGFFLGCGGMLFSSIDFAFIGHFGVGRTLLLIAGIFLTTSLPASYFFVFPPPLPKPPSKKQAMLSDFVGVNESGLADIPELPMTRMEIMKTKEFWLYFAVLFFSLLPGWALFSVYSVMFERLNVKDGGSTRTAAHYTVAANGFYTGGRLVVGWASDYFGCKTMHLSCLFVFALSFAAMPTLVDHYSFHSFFAAVCAAVFVFGGAKVLIAPTCFACFGQTSANTVVGMCLVSVSLASFVGPQLTEHTVQPQKGIASYNTGTVVWDARHRDNMTASSFLDFLLVLDSFMCKCYPHSPAGFNVLAVTSALGFFICLFIGPVQKKQPEKNNPFGVAPLSLNQQSMLNSRASIVDKFL